MSEDTLEKKTINGYFKNSRPEMVQYIPVNAKSILEIGCGEGGFIGQFKGTGRELWGVEINPEAGQKALDECDHVLIGDFNHLKEQLPKKHFDCIVFNDVLEHLYSPWDVIRFCKELLSTEGVIVSCIPNFKYISNLVTEIIIEGEFRYKPEGGILDDTHIRFFTSKSIVRMYNEQGFKILLHEGIRPCKSWKEKLFIQLSLGYLKDSKYKQYVTVSKPA